MLQILWPSHDRRGNPILELEGKLQLNGTGQCVIQLVTPENATVCSVLPYFAYVYLTGICFSVRSVKSNKISVL
nr:hypothetical protein BaRGS_001418 [Batillaria attramentaria]